MHKHLILGTCFLFCTIDPNRVTAAGCDELWAHTCYGMTVDEVLKAVPNATAHAPIDGQKVLKDAFELVLGPNQTIDSEKFAPHFYFSDNHLVEVVLTMESQTDAYKAQLVFDNVVDDLRAKYGTELSLRTSDITHEGTWLNHGTNISLLLVTIPGGTPVMNIVYQRRINQDTGRL